MAPALGGKIFSSGKSSWGSDGTCSVRRLRHHQGHWNKTEAQTTSSQAAGGFFPAFPCCVGLGSSTPRLGTAPQFIPRIKHSVSAGFMSEAVLGCFGLHPSCQNPLEEVSSGLSQILVQFLLLQDLSPAQRASGPW